MILKVEGMTCAHCVAAVTRAVKALDAGAEVTVAPGMDRVDIRTIATGPTVVEAIRDAGYPAQVAP